MQPIRGPIDYNRYPPRARRNSAARADELTPDASTHTRNSRGARHRRSQRRPPRRNRSAHSAARQMLRLATPTGNAE
jgi:hypothetical protein